MKKITKYHNSINTIPMRQWSAEEQNFFFAILTQMKDESTKEIVFNKSQLKELADFSARHNSKFETIMTNLLDKMIGLYYRERTSNTYKVLTLFSELEVKWLDDGSDLELKIQVSDKFKYILNQLEAEFTQFELRQFTTLRSTYAKTMFRHIKQWRTKGVIGGYPDGEIPKEELFLMLGVPKSMQRPTNFNQKVLKPIITELSPLFPSLKVKAIKARKVGNPIISYRFSWKQEQTGDYIQGKYDHDKKEPQIQKGLPEWTDEYKLKKAGYDTTGLTQNEMYKLRKEKGLN